jgi:hypothetical protein
MKPLKFLLLLVGIGALAMKLSSCQSSPSEAQTFSLTVRVLYPSNYAQTVASGTTVRVRNIESGTRDSAVTNAAGEARFSRLLPGTYEISASRRLSTSEAQTLTGFAVEQNLNAVLTGFALRSATDSVVTLRLAGSPVGNLVIKECYWTGSTTRSGGTYFSDQFHEIYNNSTDTIFVDSLCIADVYGPAGQINPGTRPTEFQSDQNNVYVNSIWMIPGTGRQRPLAPGQSIIIAQDGINHRADTAFAGVENRTVDLSRADWETFNERPDNRDADSPTVPNLVRVYFSTALLATVWSAKKQASLAGRRLPMWKHPHRWQNFKSVSNALNKLCLMSMMPMLYLLSATGRKQKKVADVSIRSFTAIF